MTFDEKAYNKQYNKLADAYKEFSNSNKEITYVSNPLLMELIGNVRGKDVLDIGCGSGSQLRILSDQNPNTLMGVDISEGQIDICQNNLPSHIKSKVANANDQDFIKTVRADGQKQFDVIYHSFVQVHNTNVTQTETFWANIYDLLKAGGTAVGITSDPNAAKPLGIDKMMDLEYEFPNTLKDGDTFRVHLSNELSVTSYYWTFKFVATVMKNIGFNPVQQVFVHANDVSAQVYSEKEWDRIEKSGAIYAIVGKK